ncbi:MAG: heme o synthase [Acidobacteriota bacterium]
MESQSLAIPIIRSRAADFVQLTKPRLNALAVATTLGGYYMAGPATVLGPTGSTGPWLLFNTIVGTALVAGGSAAFNQYYERVTDGLMRRTRVRPLPGHRLQPIEALWFACALSTIGLVQLAVGANLLAAAVALTTLVAYVCVYTPMKSRSPFSTLVGAIPGALPPIIGWAAVRGSLEPVSWALFAIGFLWQMPHFLAIAWLYRADYERAGFPMLPVIEPDGRSTGRQAVAYAAALVPVSLAPTAFGLSGSVYFVAAFVLSVGFLALAIRFAATRSTPSARALFFGSILYLPALWAFMIASKM